MFKRFTRTREPDLSMCERCGSVCDSVCQVEGALERIRVQALLYGLRPR